MKSQQQDHYAVLGVDPTATLEQIKAAYRKLALRYHPDKCPDSTEAEEQFKRCAAAYAVVGSEQQRAEYDALSQPLLPMSRTVSELLGELLGRREAQRADGRHVEHVLRLRLEQTLFPVQEEISVHISQTCPSCLASGAAPGGTVRCPSCAGRGFRRMEGLLPLVRRCSRCGGRGVAIQQLCRGCDGVGKIDSVRQYLVKLPTGVNDGMVQVLAGEGEPGFAGGRAGDLRIRVVVLPHAIFTAEAADVRLQLPVRFTSLALGLAVDVPTLEGTVKMKIPPGTPAGTVLRLRGRGLWSKQHRGDQLIELLPQTPTRLDEQQRHLLLAFHQACGPEIFPEEEAFARRWQAEQAPESGGGEG